MHIRQFTSERVNRPRQNFGVLFCAKCGAPMRAGSSPPSVTYYYCTSEDCNHSTKKTRPS